jgi:hypothetical protein
MGLQTPEKLWCLMQRAMPHACSPTSAFAWLYASAAGIACDGSALASASTFVVACRPAIASWNGAIGRGGVPLVGALVLPPLHSTRGIAAHARAAQRII